MHPPQTNVKVNAIDTEYKFCIHNATTGRQLFDQVVQLLKLKHVWFFGLQYTDTKGYPTWLKLKKKVFSQEMGRKRPVQLHFRAKFFPEDVGRELIDPVTIKQFYLQTKLDIINGTLYCPVDTAILLASFVLQIQIGDFDPTSYRAGIDHSDTLIPPKLVQQYSLSEEDWEEKIVSFYKDHHGIDADTGMLEYMKVAQDLEMFGINYFTIRNKKGTELLLGVDSLGLNVYEKSNKLTPKLGFPWSEIKSISFSDKKFTIKPVDETAPHFIFFAHRVRINKRILALCMGNHELYVRRRRSSDPSPPAADPAPSTSHSTPASKKSK
ncbi:hypothetical protein CAPTEDRAFT_108059 [Capitella teleta]|uniref:FERM domain-containing protein n=1 Tax=Capitella teleta TaxID=283909 RepID=R7T355_CAPTE|nr:hypothetical protein CAPTEDRAFT_137882 [Capitella teleta]ELT89050.1 hypothetical protein CAPTEDRAFT_108059 [Capitella teleta]|eukprot:ELT86981.1 hypothetical protein CAPTEDRAFT_137882 [Capitella teleta]